MRRGTGRREYPERPVVGVGGVIFDGDTVLLARRNQEPGKGVWTLPGGVVELGETLQEALCREVLEETSLTIEVGGLAKVLDRIVRDEEGAVRYHYVIVDYWGWKVSGRLRPDSDVSDARFVPLEGIESLGLHDQVVEAIREAAMRREREGLPAVGGVRQSPSSAPRKPCPGRGSSGRGRGRCRPSSGRPGRSGSAGNR